MTDVPAVMKVLAIALACGVALMLTNWLTLDRIRFNETINLRQTLSTLLPESDLNRSRLPELDRNPGLWRLCTGELLGRSAADGYAGPIGLLYTLNDGNGQLIRLAVQGHQETPGITDFLADPGWLAQFHNQDRLALAGLSTMTGATITTRAINEHLLQITVAPEEFLGSAVELACE